MEHPASLPLAVLLVLVLLILVAPSVWRSALRLVRWLLKLPVILGLTKLPGFSHLTTLWQHRSGSAHEQDPDHYFVTEKQVGELQARLEAELSGTNQPAASLPFVNTGDLSSDNSNQNAINVQNASGGAVVPGTVSRQEFGALSQVVATLSQQTKQGQLADSTLRQRIKAVTERENTRSMREARKVAATQRHLLNVKNELHSLQHLVVRQHREIKRLEVDSPEHRVSRTKTRIKKLVDSISSRKSKIDLLSTHVAQIDKILSTKDNEILSKQKNKLRVLIAKNRLDLLREEKTLRLQRLIYKVQKLPYNKQALFPVHLQQEIVALKKNQHHLSELLEKLQNRSVQDLDNLKQLREEVDESFRQLSERIELQEGVLRATSVRGYSSPLNPAANDDASDENRLDSGLQLENRILDFNDAIQEKPESHQNLENVENVVLPSAPERMQAQTHKDKNTSDHGKTTPTNLHRSSNLRGEKRSLSVSASTDRIDDLKQIFGIGYKLEVLLNKNGIFRFEQIAQLNDSEINVLSEKIGCFPDRIRRDRWVESATRLVTDRLHADGKRSAGK